MKVKVAPVGTNPMEQPELYKRQRASKLKLILSLVGATLLLCLLVVGPIYLLTRPKAALASAPTASATITATSTAQASGTPFGSSTPINSPTPGRTGTSAIASTPGTPTDSPTKAATQTPWVVTKVVDKVQVVQSSHTYEKVITVVAVQTRLVIVELPSQTPAPSQTAQPTYTEAPTQTPWIIYQTVEVTPTFTASPTPTETATPTSEPPALPSETASPTP